GAVDRARALDVDPTQLAPALRRELDDLDVGTLRLGWACDDPPAWPRRAPEAWLGQIRHRDFAARRSSSASASEFALERSLPAPCGVSHTCYGHRSHSWTHPEGWRDWPFEAPATSRMRERCQFLRDVAEDSQDLRHERIRRRFLDSHGSYEADVQGVRRRLRPRGPVCLRQVLRPAR